jgi:hypothetical protein
MLHFYSKNIFQESKTYEDGTPNRKTQKKLPLPPYKKSFLYLWKA